MIFTIGDLAQGIPDGLMKDKVLPITDVKHRTVPTKGTKIIFENGWSVDFAWGDSALYCDFLTCEVAVISPAGELTDVWNHGDTVKGYVKFPELWDLVRDVAAPDFKGILEIK